MVPKKLRFANKHHIYWFIGGGGKKDQFLVDFGVFLRGSKDHETRPKTHIN